MPLIVTLGRQSNRSEFKAKLVYIASPRPIRTSGLHSEIGRKASVGTFCIKWDSEIIKSDNLLAEEN